MRPRYWSDEAAQPGDVKMSSHSPRQDRPSAGFPELMTRLEQRLAEVEKVLDIQFIRIAQMQAELDELHKTVTSHRSPSGRRRDRSA
jgi:hypothetical protein